MAYGKISDKQREILEYIKKEILNRGYPPAVREICEAVDLKSTSSVHSHLETLEKNGYIRRDPTKPRAIEIIDEQVLPVVLKGLKEYDDYKILILPDHPTPIVTATHASDPVPFMMYHKNNEVEGVDTVNEETAKATGLFVESGVALMKKFLEA